MEDGGWKSQITNHKSIPRLVDADEDAEAYAAPTGGGGGFLSFVGLKLSGGIEVITQVKPGFQVFPAIGGFAAGLCIEAGGGVLVRG